MRIILIGLLAVSLGGCQQYQQQQAIKKKEEATKVVAAEIGECREGEMTRKNAISRMDCIAIARRKFGQAINDPFMWILEQELAADRESAVQYSEGKITKEEYKTAIQKHFANASAIEAQAFAERNQQNMQIQQQNNQALLNMYSMMPKPQPAPMPTWNTQQSQPVNTNCNVYGNNINCRSY